MGVEFINLIAELAFPSIRSYLGAYFPKGGTLSVFWNTYCHCSREQVAKAGLNFYVRLPFFYPFLFLYVRSSISRISWAFSFFSDALQKWGQELVLSWKNGKWSLEILALTAYSAPEEWDMPAGAAEKLWIDCTFAFRPSKIRDTSQPLKYNSMGLIKNLKSIHASWARKQSLMNENIAITNVHLSDTYMQYIFKHFLQMLFSMSWGSIVSAFWHPLQNITGPSPTSPRISEIVQFLFRWTTWAIFSISIAWSSTSSPPLRNSSSISYSLRIWLCCEVLMRWAPEIKIMPHPLQKVPSSQFAA